MRVPIFKAYRAFRQLDRFSDAECERFVAAALRHHWRSRIAMMLGAILIGVVVGGLGLVIAVALVLLLVPNPDDTLGVTLVVVIITTLPVGGASLSGLSVRDAWLRSILKRQIGGAKCHICGYSLLGLRADGDVVTCPECGRPFSLAEAGLTPDDLLAGADSAAGRAEASKAGQTVTQT